MYVILVELSYESAQTSTQHAKSKIKQVVIKGVFTHT